jgi:hypothetical protein
MEQTIAEPPLTLIGWREWAGLPKLGIARIKCKIDTGARTSALHAYFVQPYQAGMTEMVRFGVHLRQGRLEPSCICEAPILDRRFVTDSGGHREMRIVIATTVALGTEDWPIELTLTDRDTMRFRMLLGRTAINRRFMVDPSASYLVGKRRRRKRRQGEVK